jgi:Fe-S-cluster containining protein
MTQPAPITATGVLSVSGQRLEFEVSVPAGPTRPVELLPVFRSLADAVVGAAVDATREEGLKVSCKQGCGACCRQLVPISEIEARRLTHVVNDVPEERRAEILGRFERARQRLQDAGLLERVRTPAVMTPEQRKEHGLEYFRLGIPCPFLEDESCSIYAERPIACREYLVTSPAENCANPTAETVKCVKVPLEVSKTLRSFGGGRNDRTDQWVPLILALEWAAEHPDDAKSLPGPEMIRELFSRLTGQEVPPT